MFHYSVQCGVVYRCSAGLLLHVVGGSLEVGEDYCELYSLGLYFKHWGSHSWNVFLLHSPLCLFVHKCFGTGRGALAARSIVWFHWGCVVARGPPFPQTAGICLELFPSDWRTAS